MARPMDGSRFVFADLGANLGLAGIEQRLLAQDVFDKERIP